MITLKSLSSSAVKYYITNSQILVRDIVLLIFLYSLDSIFIMRLYSM